jgi:hypothetical protein
MAMAVKDRRNAEFVEDGSRIRGIVEPHSKLGRSAPPHSKRQRDDVMVEQHDLVTRAGKLGFSANFSEPSQLLSPDGSVVTKEPSLRSRA